MGLRQTHVPLRMLALVLQKRYKFLAITLASRVMTALTYFSRQKEVQPEVGNTNADYGELTTLPS